MTSGQTITVDCAAAGRPPPTIVWSRSHATESEFINCFSCGYHDNNHYLLPETDGSFATVTSNTEAIRLHPNNSLSISASYLDPRKTYYLKCTAVNGPGHEVTRVIRVSFTGMIMSIKRLIKV